jgi:hypothetical protein
MELVSWWSRRPASGRGVEDVGVRPPHSDTDLLTDRGTLRGPDSNDDLVTDEHEVRVRVLAHDVDTFHRGIPEGGRVIRVLTGGFGAG